jgi:predicted transposase YbfD/YdcC
MDASLVEQLNCYISSLICTAKEFALGIRGHWSIENCLHACQRCCFEGG